MTQDSYSLKFWFGVKDFVYIIGNRTGDFAVRVHVLSHRRVSFAIHCFCCTPTYDRFIMLFPFTSVIQEK